jgi:hypothetical protein
MPALSEYVNVYNSALTIIENKGFQIWFNDKAELYCAEREGWDFMAENPISLLGLIAMHEAITPSVYAEYWWKSNPPSDYQSLPTKPRAYVSVVSMKPGK